MTATNVAGDPSRAVPCLVSINPCGCVRDIVVNDGSAEDRRRAGSVAGKAVRAGLTVETWTVGRVRDGGWEFRCEREDCGNKSKQKRPGK